MPGLRALPPLARWIAIALIAIVVVVAGFAVLFLIRFPFTRTAVTQLLAEQTGGTATIAKFSRVYFPPGFIAQGVTVKLPGVNGPPLISVQRAEVNASYTGLLSKPERIARIRLDGFRLHIPKSAPPRKQSNNNKDQMLIERVVANGAQLEFETGACFAIHRAVLRNVASDRRLMFDTALTIPEPPGEVQAHGTFGPWAGRQTPAAGSYQFRHADLGRFKGLGGLLASDGTFSGPLSHMKVDGWTDVPNFEANESGHPIRLQTQFHAQVDGTSGDVWLDQVDASFRGTRVVTNGVVDHDKGTSLNLELQRARIEDFLLMLLEPKTPGLFGAFTAHLNANLPAGNEQFIKKLRLAGDFGITRASFSSPQTQQGIDQLSERAQGQKDQGEDPERVLSNLKGHVQMSDGIAHFSHLSFTVPGALIRLHGTYDLPREYVHLDGTLHMEATPSQATHGIVSFLLKPINRLFRNKKHTEGTVIPIHIVGPYSDTQVHITPLPSKSGKKAG